MSERLTILESPHVGVEQVIRQNAPRDARFHTRVHVPFVDSEGTYPIGVENLNEIPAGSKVGASYEVGSFVAEIEGVPYCHTHKLSAPNIAFVGGIPCVPK